MRICFSVTNLEPGGAQTFVIRLASKLAGSGHEVHIYDHWPEFRRNQLVAGLSPSVELHSYCELPLLRSAIWKINALLKLTGVHKRFRHSINERRFKKMIQRHRIQVVNSHMSYSDFVCARLKPEKCAFVPTLHGEYELGFTENRDQRTLRDDIREVVRNSSLIIYTAEKNLIPLKKYRLPECRKIFVGADGDQLGKVKPLSRSDLGLNAEDFVAGMISRGIPEKGWRTAIEAVRFSRTRSDRKIVLILVGEGDHVSEITRGFDGDLERRLEFANNYWDYLSVYSLLDLFIFPTLFEGESVPNVVSESLYFEVPLLATRHAEVPAMIGAGTPEAAGICVEPGNELAHEMGRMVARLAADENEIKRLRSHCRSAFQRFDLDAISRTYVDAFETALTRAKHEKSNFRGDG